MPTDATIIDRLRDEDACWSPQSGYDIAGMCALMRDAADALTAAHAALAECYRLTGADPDGNEDWRLAERAVAQVKRLREESDAEIAAAHAARDAAEREREAYRAQMMAAGHVPYLDRMRELAEQRDSALRERDEARAALSRGTGVSP